MVEGSDCGSYMVKMLNSDFVLSPESKRGSRNGPRELLLHRTRLHQRLEVKVEKTGGHVETWILKPQWASFESLSQNTSVTLKGAFDLQTST